ncbi:MAG TPA: hypothetical protein ACFYED_01670 [Candidatus Tripitaka californicus]|uniref:hypothetical protein n=1 Tax=Candidatus Tripitaka californicus TaxID=3367616 RepID=UPI004026B25C|nr:hypothetical protein [Planctomycetota bacterium]
MKDFSASILKSFENLFLKFSIPRLFYFVTLILIVVAALFYFESQTGFFFFHRMGKKVALLKELQLLATGGIAQSVELSPIYQQTTEELDAYEPFAISQFFHNRNISTSVQVWKTLSGASIGFLGIILGLFAMWKKNEKLGDTAVIGGVLVGLLGGMAGYLLPIFYMPWFNYIGFPLLLLVVIMKFLGAQKASTTTQPSSPTVK